MNWAKLEENIDTIAASVAEKIGVSATPIVRDAVRDTVHALKEGKIKEFGGLEARCVEAIRQFDLSQGDPAPATADIEPVKAPQTKRGKN